jgi:hypothetical protein
MNPRMRGGCRHYREGSKEGIAARLGLYIVRSILHPPRLVIEAAWELHFSHFQLASFVVQSRTPIVFQRSHRRRLPALTLAFKQSPAIFRRSTETRRHTANQLD